MSPTLSSGTFAVPPFPTVAIMGPGAIGTTVAAALHQAGRTPLLCGRTPRERLKLQRNGELVQVPGPVLTAPADVDRPVGVVFLAVKATQVAAAAPWLAALCERSTVVCVLQNGVEQESTVAPLVPGCAVLPAVVWFPAQAQPDGSVRLCGDARLTLPDRDDALPVRAALRDSWCTVELSSDFVSVAWRKLLQNAAAGLMVLTGRRSGLFGRADVAELTRAYLGECLAVARAEGADLGVEVPQQILDYFQAQPADLGTSILTDREAGRPLEWDVRNGVVQRRGASHHIPTPISDIVVALLAASSDGPG